MGIELDDFRWWVVIWTVHVAISFPHGMLGGTLLK